MHASVCVCMRMCVNRNLSRKLRNDEIMGWGILCQELDQSVFLSASYTQLPYAMEVLYLRREFTCFGTF